MEKESKDYLHIVENENYDEEYFNALINGSSDAEEFE